MVEKTEDLQHRLGSSLVGSWYWIFALIGALMIVATTYKPFFLAYMTTALVVVVCALAWGLWRNAPKIARYGIALITLAAFVFMLYNSLAVLYGWSSYIQHPSEADAVTYGTQIYMGLFTNNTASITAGVGGLTESVSVSALVYGMGGIGSLLFLVSGLMGIMAARRS
jgi:energy-coupling factor transporter transmembrane protein EcfT